MELLAGVGVLLVLMMFWRKLRGWRFLLAASVLVGGVLFLTPRLRGLVPPSEHIRHVSGVVDIVSADGQELCLDMGGDRVCGTLSMPAGSRAPAIGTRRNRH